VDKAFIIGLILTVVLPFYSFAQKDTISSHPNYVWLMAGFGFSTENVSADLNLSYQHGSNLFIARLAGVYADLEHGYTDLGILYGRASRGTKFHSSISIGPAWVHECGSCSNAFGASILGQISFRKSPIGLGIYSFVNINKLNSYAAIGGAIYLGKLK